MHRVKFVVPERRQAMLEHQNTMHKHRYLHPAPLIALAGMALSGPAALAQQPGRPPPPAPAAQAQTNSSASSAAAPSSRSGQSGGITLQLMGTLVEVHPTVKLEARHDDNIYSTPDKRVSDQILVMTPALELAARQGPNTYKLRLATVIGNYQSHSSENYANTSLNALADLGLGTRLRARLQGDYTDGADARGSTNNALSPTPDRYRQTRGRGVFSFGAPGARGRLDLELGRSQREYLNNRATTVASDRAVDDLAPPSTGASGPRPRCCSRASAAPWTTTTRLPPWAAPKAHSWSEEAGKRAQKPAARSG
jgi:hypothetical protein